jgi:predicted RecB family nuclease
MAVIKKTIRVCKNGHKYYKSSDCPTCPICEAEKNNEGFLAMLSAPARRALVNNRITTLKQLAEHSKKEILSFHGMGPASIPVLRSALKKEGLNFKK